MSELVLLLTLTLLVSFVYSSVGHGGASGYLALLSFFSISPMPMSATALCLNVLVAGLASLNFYKAGHGSWNLITPFIATSIPCAFLGGWLRIPAGLYEGLLAGALFFACFRMLLNPSPQAGCEEPPLPVALITGGAIGLISGMVGVGGGIFLSPLLILFHWADPKKTAAASALFILVNSIAGLAGKFSGGTAELTPHLVLMAFAAFTGGVVGSRLGARHFSNLALRRVLAGVLFFAGVKLL